MGRLPSGLPNMDNSKDVRPMSSSRVYPVMASQRSFTSRNRPSSIELMMTGPGLWRNVAANRSSLSFNSADALFLAVTSC